MALKIDSLEVTITTQANSASAAVGNLNKELNKMIRKNGKLKEIAGTMEEIKENAGGVVGGTGGSKGGSKGGGFFGAVSKKAGGFFKSVGRIALYRGIRTALKAVTNAVKEGTSNLYQYSKLMGGSFATNLDKISTSVQYLKNGIAAGLAPAIEALTPTIIAASDAIADAGNRLSEMYAWKNGKDTFTKATKSAKEYAASLKEVKNAVLGFDELNILDNTTEKFADMFGTGDVDPHRAEETQNWLTGILAGTVGVVGASKLAQWFPSLLGFSQGSNGQAEYNLGNVVLKAAGLSLTIAGGVTGISGLMEALQTSFRNDEAVQKLGLGLFETGAGLAIMTKNPIPLLLGITLATAAVEKSLYDSEIYNATHDKKTGEAWYEDWQLEGMMDPIQWTFAGKPGNTYSKYVADYAAAKAAGKAYNNSKVTLEELNAARTSGNAKLYEYYKQVMRGERARDYELELMYKTRWASSTGYSIQDDPTAGNSDYWVSKGNRFNDFIGWVNPEDLELGGTASGSNSGVLVYGSMNGVEGELGASTANTGAQEINIYLDGKQILGAIRKADTLSGLFLANGVVWE